MAGHDDLDRVRPLAERVVRSYGLELFDVQLRREAIGWVLRVTIDRPAPRDADGRIEPEPYARAIGIAECQEVSRDLGTLLDVEAPLERTYTLEVSSPGLDRPLRHADDYLRFSGRPAKIVASEPLDGQTHFTGRIKGLQDGAVLLEQGRRTHRVPLALISRARLEVEF